MNKRNRNRLDVKVSVGHTLFAGDGLDALESILSSLVPWSASMHAWEDDVGKRPLAGGFAAAIESMACERGELYQQLIALHGVGPYERRNGVVELRGGENSLIVVISMDELVFAPSAGRYLWGNSVAFQFLRKTCCGEPAPHVARRLLELCCTRLDVLYGRGNSLDEWDAKNEVLDHGAAWIAGVDMSRYLPGLYWLNYFGAPYCELMGRDRLLAAPVSSTASVRDGVLVQVDESPDAWTSESSNYEKAIDYIGRQYFFLRDEPDRETRAPEFGLPALKRWPDST